MRPAQMRSSAWMTIHLCLKLLLLASRMYRKISLKNTCKAHLLRDTTSEGVLIECVRGAHLDLHLKVLLEILQQRQENRQRQFENLKN